MKKSIINLALLAISLSITACSSPPTSASSPGQAITLAQPTTFVQACAAYKTAFNTALQLRIAGDLTTAQINSVTLIDSQVTPLCTGPLPQDGSAIVAEITAAAINLAAILPSTSPK